MLKYYEYLKDRFLKITGDNWYAVKINGKFKNG